MRVRRLNSPLPAEIAQDTLAAACAHVETRAEAEEQAVEEEEGEEEEDEDEARG